jgi:hypothetical protein
MIMGALSSEYDVGKEEEDGGANVSNDGPPLPLKRSRRASNLLELFATEFDADGIVAFDSKSTANVFSNIGIMKNEAMLLILLYTLKINPSAVKLSKI